MIVEIITGALVGSAYFMEFGLWTIATACGCAALWRLGGADGYSKAYRRYGVPAVLTLPLLIVYTDWWFGLSYAAMVGLLSLGYGIPSTQPFDEGSTLGKFWYNIFQDGEKASVATRATISCGLGLALLPLAFHSPINYVVGATITAVGIPLIDLIES